ncbi:unnamed protein product [Ilex paraguariensis]|uniref:Uncharacterized protein n=1 Tax=Ilex paraguariensis TaxID=185542 RepID=A0ABC8S5M3_9AQUA
MRVRDGYESLKGVDNTILNYWNLQQADKLKLWITDKINEQQNSCLLYHPFLSVVSKSWAAVPIDGNSDWFKKQAELVEKVVSTMPVHLQVNYKESIKNDQSLTICNSEVFYIPRKFVADFSNLINLVGDLDIHHKVAIPLFFLAMDSAQNFDSVFNAMIYEQKPPTNSSKFILPKCLQFTLGMWPVSRSS